MRDLRILNLGCGFQVSPAPEVTNIDWRLGLRLARNPVLRHLMPLVVGPERRARLPKLEGNLLVRDLSKGIPAADGSVDAIFHSHLLEHLDREVVEPFMHEIRRVLKPGGIHRVVVPDLEGAIRGYVANLERGGSDHDQYIAAFLAQSVQREASGTSMQSGPRRRIENLLLGDARRRGQTHQWMYDFLNLSQLLERTGFDRIERYDYNRSAIPGWNEYGLDRDSDGNPHKPGSIYVEARVPG